MQAAFSAQKDLSALIWIGNGQIVLPDRIHKNGSVLVQNGRIIAINVPRPEEAAFYNARGAQFCPALLICICTAVGARTLWMLILKALLL